MHVTIVYVTVKKEHIDDFIEASRLNHEGSVKEPGNRRFDVVQSTEDPTRFVLFETYVNGEEAARHKQTEHYLRWRDTVGDWMVEPRKGVSYTGLYPK